MIFLELFWTFFKIGLFTFGGGYAMLPLIQQEVLTRNWATNEELINFVAVAESTPGPFAINMSTYVGAVQGRLFAEGDVSSQLFGLFGSFCATLGVVLPSFIIILIVAKCFEKFKTNRIVAGCMTGIKPAAIGLIGAALISIGKTVFFPHGFSVELFSTAALWVSAGIFLVMAILAFRKVHPILIICLSAAVGIAAGYLLDLSL